MADEQQKDDRLRDSEVAIVDALKMMMEILVATGTVKPSVFEKVFALQRDNYIAKDMPNAAVIMEVLRGFAAKPIAAPGGNAGRTEIDKPPQGSA